jgi:transposase
MGCPRKTVHAWLRRYRQEGLPGLTDRSHRPHHHPGQLAAEVEARVCELRRTHPRWGPRRLVHELCRLGITPGRHHDVDIDWLRERGCWWPFDAGGTPEVNVLSIRRKCIRALPSGDRVPVR